MAECGFDMKSALAYAIHAEIQAHEFYKTWAQNARTPALKRKSQNWQTGKKRTKTLYLNITKSFLANPSHLIKCGRGSSALRSGRRI